jgi:hypothetical protein
MNTAAGLGQQREPAGDHGAEGGKRATVGFALAVLSMRLGPDSALLAALVDLADGLDSDVAEAESGRIKAALAARSPAFDQVFPDITDATAADRARATANLALLSSSVREEER